LNKYLSVGLSYSLCLLNGIGIVRVVVVVRSVYLTVGIEVSVMTQGWMGEGERGCGQREGEGRIVIKITHPAP
jgi:hypothetical protein